MIGSVKRTSTSTLATVFTFGNPLTTRSPRGTAPTNITVNLVKSAPVAFTSAVTERIQ